MRLNHFLYDFTDIMYSKGPTGLHSDGFSELYGFGGGENSKQRLQFSLDLNFGEVEFDWDKRSVTLRVLGRDIDAKPLLSANWTLEQLSGKSNMPETKSKSYFFSSLENEISIPNNYTGSDWNCVPHRGYPSLIRWRLAQITSLFFYSIIIFSIMFTPGIISLIVIYLSLKYIHSKKSFVKGFRSN